MHVIHSNIEMDLVTIQLSKGWGGGQRYFSGRRGGNAKKKVGNR